MSPSKLDARHRARDFRVDPDQSKQRRHEGGRKLNLHHIYKDVTTVTYLQNRPDEDSRYVVLDELPEIDETWIEKTVIVRSPVGGAPDRAYLGVQLPDDTLAWIEISIMSPAPPTTGGGGGAVGAPTYTWTSHLGVGVLGGGTAQGLDTDISGNIWIGSPLEGTGHLRKFSPAGVALVDILLPHPGSSVARPRGLGVQQSDNDVWVGDSATARVHHYNTSGVDQTAWTPGGIVSPYGLAFNAAESILALGDANASTHYVRFYNFPALTLITTLSSFGGPTGVDFDSAGNIYICDTTRHVIYQYSPTYALLDTWGTVNVLGTGNKEFQSPYGVHVDASDRVYVIDTYNHRVQVFATDGDFLTSFGGVGSGNGSFQYPYDLTTFGANVYVSDSNNNRISVWTIS